LVFIVHFRLSDFQAVDIEGLFTRELKPCGYIWSFNFKEKYTKSPENHTLPQEGRLSPAPDGPVVDKQISPRVDESASSKGKRYTAEKEEALMVNLKEIEELSWPRIAAHFPKRAQMALQARYYTKLKKKQHKNRLKDIINRKMAKQRLLEKILEGILGALVANIACENYDILQIRNHPW
jgi:hypothetical protein